MATSNALSPLEQLELHGKVPDSGVVDRIATHQEIAVPHWVEMRDGCLIGRYSSSMPLSEAVEEIRRAEAADELTPADLDDLAGLRKLDGFVHQSVKVRRGAYAAARRLPGLSGEHVLPILMGLRDPHSSAATTASTSAFNGATRWARCAGTTCFRPGCL